MPARRRPSTTGVPRARRWWTWTARAAGAALVAGLVYFFWPSSFGGCSTLTIVSGHSMEPTYSTGDLVWSRCGEPEVGDVVVYSAPGTRGAQVIHRIIGGDGADGWVLQGDNNNFVDPWTPDDSHVLGVASVRVPVLGSVVHGLGNPFVWASLLVLATATALWPRARAREDAVESAFEEPADAERSSQATLDAPATTDRTEEEGEPL